MIGWLARLTPGRRRATGLPPLTWRCHVCGRERPDRLVAVHTRVYPVRGRRPGLELRENVRYCADRDDCRERAKTYSHLGEGQAITRGIAVLPDLRPTS